MYDPLAPATLIHLQQWFAGIITQPLVNEESIQPQAPSGALIEDEAKKWIEPSPTLQPHQRIELYNQQYWWRLLNILKKTFPLVTRIVGIDRFHKELAVPYLERFPPDHWSLERLGDRFYTWANEEFFQKERALVLHSIALDWTYNRCEVEKRQPPPSASQALQYQKLYLQPAMELFAFPFDLFAFRQELLEEEDLDFWCTHPLPTLKQDKESYFFLFYRDKDHYLCWEEILPVPYAILRLFQQGATVSEVCEQLEKKELFSEDDCVQFPNWLRHWASMGFLTTKNQESLFSL